MTLEINAPATAGEARQQAIDFQAWASQQSFSYGELLEWQSHFEAVVERFPELKDEFEENGIL